MRRYWALFLVEILLFLLALASCFAGERLVGAMTGADLAEGRVRLSESLTPGVYQVRVTADVPKDATLFVNVEDNGEFFQELRCNGTAIFGEQRETDFEVYVLGFLDDVYVTCVAQNVDASALVSLEIYRTGLGGRILCVCVLVGALLVNGLLFYRRRVLEGKVSWQQQVAFWVLVLCVALAYFPYATDYYSVGGDFAFHMLRIEGLKETLMQGGQFPVRVQSYWLQEHGYAVSVFYGDLFLLLPVLLRLAGFSLMTAYKIYVLLAMAATAAVAYYSLRMCTKSDSAALMGSVVYVLAPYRIYNFYNRVAVGEYTAMVFLPLVICGMYRLYTEEVDTKAYARAKIPLIIGLSGILQCHLLTCEMAVCGILLTCLVLLRKTLRKRTFLQLLQAAGITVLLNCWFWLPLLRMMRTDTFGFHDLVNHDIQEMGTMVAGILQVWPYKGGYQTGMYNCEPIQIGAASLCMLGLFWALIIWKRVSGGKKEGKNAYAGVVLFFAIGSVLLVFMGTNLFPWDFMAKVPGIRFLVTALQFPTRMLSPASAFCAMFAAFFWLWVKKEVVADNRGAWREITIGLYCAVLFLAIFSEVFHVNSIAYENPPLRLYTAENLGSVTVLNGEYLLGGVLASECRFHDPIAEEGLEWRDYVKKGTNLSIYVNNTGGRELYLELPVMGYRGYGIDGEEAVARGLGIAEERGSHGDLRVVVPAGYSGELRISYKSFASDRMAEVVSAVTIFGIGIYSVGRKSKVRFSTQGV